MKYCSKCRVKKVNAEFSKRNDRKQGLQVWCRECTNKISKEYRAGLTKTRGGRLNTTADIANYILKGDKAYFSFNEVQIFSGGKLVASKDNLHEAGKYARLCHDKDGKRVECAYIHYPKQASPYEVWRVSYEGGDGDQEEAIRLCSKGIAQVLLTGLWNRGMGTVHNWTK